MLAILLVNNIISANLCLKSVYYMSKALFEIKCVLLTVQGPGIVRTSVVSTITITIYNFINEHNKRV